MSMHRELNPQLFGTTASPEKPSPDAQGPLARPSQNQQRQVPYPPLDLKNIEQQMASLRLALLQMEKRNEAFTARMDDVARSVHARMDRFAQALVRLEEIQNHHNQDNTTKFAQVVAKVNERKVSDTKIQELIDRHNTIVRNFENRMVLLQRLVTEQEMALHNAQAALEDARAEIIKNKR